MVKFWPVRWNPIRFDPSVGFPAEKGIVSMGLSDRSDAHVNGRNDLLSKLAVFSAEEHDHGVGKRVEYKAEIIPGQILSGPQFNEPMRVETVRPNGRDMWVLGLVGTQSEQEVSGNLPAPE